MREVFAKKLEKTGSAFALLHLGHLIRLRERSLMRIVSENRLPHPPHRKS